jgi:hypothetical protein
MMSLNIHEFPEIFAWKSALFMLESVKIACRSTVVPQKLMKAKDALLQCCRYFTHSICNLVR